MDKKLLAYVDSAFPRDVKRAIPLVRTAHHAFLDAESLVPQPKRQKKRRNTATGGLHLTSDVFVEGPNGSGKSTLIEALRKIGLPSVHTGGPKRNLSELLSSCRRVSRRGRPRVIDRMPMISEIVYDRALGRKPKMNHKELIKKIGPLNAPLVIYCRVPLKDMTPIHRGTTHPADHASELKRHTADLVRQYDLLISRLSARGLIRVVIHNYVESTTPLDVIDTLRLAKILCAD